MENYFIGNREKTLEHQKNYHHENQERIQLYQNKYQSDNRVKRKEYLRKRGELELNFKSAHKLKSRISHVFKSQSVRKVNKTFDFLDCCHILLNWISHQLYGDRTLKKQASVKEIHRCIPISSFNLLDVNEKKKFFSWII